MTEWQFVNEPALAWSQSCDLEEAQAWIEELAARTRVAVRDAAAAGNYAGQVRAVARAWEAAGNVFRCLNLPPLSSPTYRVLMTHWYGGLGNLDFQAASRQANAAPYAQGSAHPDSVVFLRLRDAWAAMGRDPVTGDHSIGRIVVHAALAQPDAFAVVQCVDGRSGSGECDFGGADTGCAAIDATTEGCDPWTWQSWAWSTPNSFGRPDESTFPRIDRANPPLAWSWEIVRELSDALTAQGAYTVLDSARLWVIAENLDVAAALVELPEQLSAQARAIHAAVADAMRNPPAFRELLAGAAVAVTALAVVPPPAGPIAAAVVGLFAAIVQFLPGAYGILADSWGRALPVFERATIATSADGVPNYQVPDPPGWVRGAPRRTLGPLGLRYTVTATPRVTTGANLADTDAQGNWQPPLHLIQGVTPAMAFGAAHPGTFVAPVIGPDGIARTPVTAAEAAGAAAPTAPAPASGGNGIAVAGVVLAALGLGWMVLR